VFLAYLRFLRNTATVATTAMAITAPMTANMVMLSAETVSSGVEVAVGSGVEVAVGSGVEVTTGVG